MSLSHTKYVLLFAACWAPPREQVGETQQQTQVCGVAEMAPNTYVVSLYSADDLGTRFIADCGSTHFLLDFKTDIAAGMTPDALGAAFDNADLRFDHPIDAQLELQFDFAIP